MSNLYFNHCEDDMLLDIYYVMCYIGWHTEND